MSAAPFNPRARISRRRMIAAILGVGLGWCVTLPLSAQDANLSEYQVKALCLFNFAKYVEWPAGTFPAANTPVTIGVMGKSGLFDIMTATVAGKSVEGHPLVVTRVEEGDAPPECQILFVSSSEAKKFPRVLQQLENKPVLTVGEGHAFTEEDGMIGFVLRDKKVRFEINVAAAGRVHLKISSRLLVLADTVRGKSP